MLDQTLQSGSGAVLLDGTHFGLCLFGFGCKFFIKISLAYNVLLDLSDDIVIQYFY